MLGVRGFDGLAGSDPTGSNPQGPIGDHTNYYTKPITGETVYALYLNDGDMWMQGAGWLQQNGGSGVLPWCLTVSFVNPHDKEFFRTGTTGAIRVAVRIV